MCLIFFGKKGFLHFYVAAFSLMGGGEKKGRKKKDFGSLGKKKGRRREADGGKNFCLGWTEEKKGVGKFLYPPTTPPLLNCNL